MGKGKKNKKDGGHKKTAPAHVPQIPRTELYSIIKKLKTHLHELKQLETPKTDEEPKKAKPLMRRLKHAPGGKNDENTSIGGLFSPSEIFDKYKKDRQGILNTIRAQASESEVLKAQESILEIEKQFIVDLGDQVKARRGIIDPVDEMAHYTKKLYGYLKLLMLAANKANVSPQDTYDKEVSGLDSPDAGSYTDVLKKDRVLILRFEAKKHSLLSEFYTEKAQALENLPTGEEGSDLALQTKLDKNEKDATDTFKRAQQELWVKHNPIAKMLACLQ
tara:strand:- start:340 stop:1167 length:828 start_codon:yes stop_codon:yes gene_type:complete